MLLRAAPDSDQFNLQLTVTELASLRATLDAAELASLDDACLAGCLREQLIASGLVASDDDLPASRTPGECLTPGERLPLVSIGQGDYRRDWPDAPEHAARSESEPFGGIVPALQI